MDATVNAEVWKKYFSLPLFESENSEHKRIHSRHDGVPHRASNMFTVGKQRSVWTVSTASTQQTSAFLLVHSRKNQTLTGAFFQTPTPLWDQSSKQNAFVTVQWVPIAFLEDCLSIHNYILHKLITCHSFPNMGMNLIGVLAPTYWIVKSA